jgi:integrase
MRSSAFVTPVTPALKRRGAALTDVSIRNLKPGPIRREIPDPGARGLYVVVQPSGAKSFAVRYRFKGKPRKLTLNGMTLAAARQAAATALLEVNQGRDPGEAKKTAEEKAAAAAADTVQAICEEFIRREGGRLRTVDERQRILARLVYPKLGSRPVDALKRTEIVRLLDRIEDTSGPRMAHQTLSVLRRVLNWHASRSDEFRSPIVRGMGRVNTKDRARSRILTDDELRRVWATATAGEGPFPAFIRFLLLTGARREEVAAMPWAELDGAGNWELPSSRNKAKFDLLRPLSQAARVIVAEQPRTSDFVFTGGRRPLSGISKLKKAFDESCGVTGWILHDLRRSARSLMSRAGVNSDHAERCLGHVIPGVRGIYDRYEYRDEKAKVYEALAAQIERIVEGPQDNVVALADRR